MPPERLLGSGTARRTPVPHAARAAPRLSSSSAYAARGVTGSPTPPAEPARARVHVSPGPAGRVGGAEAAGVRGGLEKAWGSAHARAGRGRAGAGAAGPAPGRQAPHGPSVLTVNRQLVRRARGRGRLLVHGGMEHDVGLLRLYPGIPATLVRTRPAPPGPSAPHGPQSPPLLPSLLCRPFLSPEAGPRG